LSNKDLPLLSDYPRLNDEGLHHNTSVIGGDTNQDQGDLSGENLKRHI